MAKKNNKLKLSMGITVFDIVNYTFLTLFLLICTYPFYYVFINSIASAADISQGVFLWPKKVELGTYTKLLTNKEIPHAFMISTLRTVISTVLTVVFSSMFAYLVTQQDMFGRKFVYRFLIFTMFASGGLIPGYLTMKAYGLHNSFLLYIIPATINTFFVILVKTYIESLPSSLEESAAMDGAGFFTLFFKIIFPLAKPVVATIAVFKIVGEWNTYFDNYLMVSDPKLQTMQLILFKIIREADRIAAAMREAATSGSATAVSNAAQNATITPESVRNATTIITIIPIMCVYPFLQKYYTKGIMMGAIKG